MKLWERLAAAVALLALLVALDPTPGYGQPVSVAGAAAATLIQQGEYLAHAADCVACHSAPGGAAYAGGRGMGSPLGTIYTTNITPDPDTGIGKWSADDIAALLKSGQTPEFDFVGGGMAQVVSGTAKLTDEDRHAMAVFLKSVPPLRATGK